MTHSYNNSFFKDSGVATSTARAGNVIGGGDFAKDRIIPDCVRAVESGDTLIIRNPVSIRPYQHVLEPIFAYLMIAAEQCRDDTKAGFYNIGPELSDCISTGELVKFFGKCYGDSFKFEIRKDSNAVHEANFLKLDTSLVESTFNWHPIWKVEEAVEKTVEWTKDWLCDGSSENMNRVLERQLKDFIRKTIL